MNRPRFRLRRRAHQQTPFIVGFFALIVVLGSGALSVVGSVRRAHGHGVTLGFAAQAGAFVRGCLGGVGVLLLLIAFMFLVVACVIVKEGWQQRRRKKKPR